jgi:hypothetical protein
VADFLTDSFTDAAGTALIAHPADVGSTWTQDTAGALTIQGSALTCSASSARSALNGASAPGSDYSVSCSLLIAYYGDGDRAGVYGRLDGPLQNGYLAIWNDSTGSYELYSLVSSVPMLIGSQAAPLQTTGSFRIELRMVGTTISVYVDNVLLISVTDSSVSAPGGAGLYFNTSPYSDISIDDIAAGDPPVSPVHVVTGRGNFVIVSPPWLQVVLSGIPARVSFGSAEPRNYFHVGIISWGTANGTLLAYPVTRELELVSIPAGMTILSYYFAPGVTATITEMAAP